MFTNAFPTRFRVNQHDLLYLIFILHHVRRLLCFLTAPGLLVEPKAAYASENHPLLICNVNVEFEIVLEM